MTGTCWQHVTFEVDFVGADVDVDIEEVLALDGPVSSSVPAHAAQVTNKGGAAAVHLVKTLYSLKSCFLSFGTIISLLAHHM
jgi:hypothetical protein